MIVRILGIGQFRLDDAARAAVNAADDKVEVAFAAGDEEAMHAALAELADTIQRVGTPLAADEFVGSDVVVPGPDTTIEEAAGLLTPDEGLIPDT